MSYNNQNLYSQNASSNRVITTFEGLVGAVQHDQVLGSAYKDLTLRYRYSSNAYAKAYGIDEAADLIGKPDTEFLAADIAKANQIIEQEIISDGLCDVRPFAPLVPLSELSNQTFIVRQSLANDLDKKVGLEIALVSEALLSYPLGVALGIQIGGEMSPLMVIKGSRLLYVSAEMEEHVPNTQQGDDVREALGLNHGEPLEHQLLAARRQHGDEFYVITGRGQGRLRRWQLQSMSINWLGERALLVGFVESKSEKEKSDHEASSKNVVPLANYRSGISRDPYRQLLENSANGVLILSGLRPVYANQSVADLLGFSNGDGVLSIDNVLQLFSDSDKAKLNILSLYAGDNSQTDFVVDLRRRDTVPLYDDRRLPRILSVHFAVSRIYWRGEPALLCSLTDLTEQGSEQQRLRENQERFKDFAESAADFFFELDQTKQLVFVSDSIESILGITPSDLVGGDYIEEFEPFIEEHEISSFQRDIKAMNEKTGVQEIEYKWLRPNDEPRFIQQICKPIFDEHGGFRGYRGVGRDVTVDRQLAEQVSYHASHDSLTGLLNRREFELRLRNAVDDARQNKAVHAICYIDLDNFKIVNDTCGHSAGDELLRQLGNMLQQKVRRSDALARLGGDEFGIVIYHCDPVWAENVADQVRQAVENFLFLWDGNRFSVGASIGVVVIDDQVESSSAVMSAADEACYTSKDRGRNNVVVANREVSKEEPREEASWVIKINQALQEKRFVLFSQSYAPLSPENDNGNYLELLIRLETEEGDIVSPQAFMPAAERYGLAPKIDLMVLTQCLEWLETSPRVLEDLASCAINITAHSLRDSRVLDNMVALVRNSNVPGEKLCFEISETTTIANLSSAREFIARLAEHGCRFSLDDFGSGMSSFQFLRDLPIEFLKIDGLFVRGMLEDQVSQAMVRSINEISHVLGRKTIAESVESEDIIIKLKDYGVDFAQGFIVDRPHRIRF